MKIIFLDIDGVLNCASCKVEIDGYLFVMDSKIGLLRQLIDETDAKVVLTSTWRQGWFDLEEGIESWNRGHFVALRDKLQEFGIVLLAYTPLDCCKGNEDMNERYHKTRGQEIEAWFHAWKGENIESFVILDDMNGIYLRPYSDRLVRTSLLKGLEPKHVKKAVKILANPWRKNKRNRLEKGYGDDKI